MGLEYMRWWHWVLISLLVGYVLAYANSSPPEPVGLTEQQVVEFERDVMHAPIGQSQMPWVRHLIVYPVTEKAALGKPAEIVLYEALAHKANAPANEFYYRACWFCAAVPFIPTTQNPVLGGAAPDVVAAARKATGNNRLPAGMERIYIPKPDETLESITAAVYGKYTGAGQEAIATANLPFRYNHSIQKLIDMKRWSLGRAMYIPWNPAERKTVRDWLDTEDKKYSWVKYQYAWWKDPKYCNLVWMGSTFAVVGVIWPMMLSVMSGAGLGRAPKAAEGDYDPRRFATKTKAKMPAATSQEMSEERKQQLASLNQSLADSVKDGIGIGQAAPGAPAAGPKIPGRQFTPAAATEAAPAPAGEKPQESKDFTGEFYPVARPTVKEPDAPKPLDPQKGPKLP